MGGRIIHLHKTAIIAHVSLDKAPNMGLVSRPAVLRYRANPATVPIKIKDLTPPSLALNTKITRTAAEMQKNKISSIKDITVTATSEILPIIFPASGTRSIALVKRKISKNTPRAAPRIKE